MNIFGKKAVKSVADILESFNQTLSDLHTLIGSKMEDNGRKTDEIEALNSQIKSCENDIERNNAEMEHAARVMEKIQSLVE